MGGIKAAYGAYQQFVQQNGPEPILPNLNYTSNQLFWISAGQTYCTQSKFDTQPFIISNHSPANYRVFGAFSSSTDFSNDFNCEPKTLMNPENKCEIWWEKKNEKYLIDHFDHLEVFCVLKIYNENTETGL